MPSVEEAEVIATSRVGWVTRLSHCQVGQLAGLDVDLGPLHLGAVPVRRAQPRRDVGLVVEAGHHHLIAEAHPGRRRIGQRRQQHRAVGAQHHAGRVGVDQIGHRLAGGGQHRGTARADGCGPAGVGIEPRNAVDTALATESGSSMPFWASKCTQPSPKRRVQTTHPGDVVCHASPP